MLPPDDRLVAPCDRVAGAGLDVLAGADCRLTPPSVLRDDRGAVDRVAGARVAGARVAGARVAGARVGGVAVVAGGAASLVDGAALLGEGVTARVRFDRLPDRVDVWGAGTARVAELRCCPGETVRVRVPGSDTDVDGVRVLAAAVLPLASEDRTPRS